MAFHIFFAVAIFFDVDINQIDVKIVFLYGLINYLIYVEISKESKIKTN